MCLGTGFVLGQLSPEGAMLLLLVALVLLFIGFLVFLAKRYKRCPPNRILVVYGKVRTGTVGKCVHGGGTFVLPLIQDYAYLHLDPLQIEIPLTGALSAENIRINVPSVFTVAIGTTPDHMHNAAIRLQGLSSDAIAQQTRDIIFGQLRQVIASMGIEDINRDRDQFLQRIQSSLEPELSKIGLVLINVNITDITDESGYIDAIGRKAASQAVQQAEIDVAEQRKRGSIGVAEAQREQEIQVAIAEKERQVGTTAAQKEQAVGVANLQRERHVGEKQAAFLGEAQTKEAEREMRIAVAEANARAVAGENKAKATIAAAEAELRVKEAEAYQLAETRRREAEASVLEAQYRALAKAAAADAQKTEAEQRAALEAPARALKAKITVDAEAEADRKRIDAEADAKAIFLRLEAQARGEYELLSRKAEGLERLVTSCGGAQAAFQMLMLEHLDRLALTAASAISNVKFDKVVVWDSGGENGGAAGFVKRLGGMLPPMLQIMKDVGGIEMPEFFGKMTGTDGVGRPAASGAPAAPTTTEKPAGTAPPPRNPGKERT